MWDSHAGADQEPEMWLAKLLQFCYVGLRIGLPPPSPHAFARIAVFKIQLPGSSHGIHVPA